MSKLQILCKYNSLPCLTFEIEIEELDELSIKFLPVFKIQNSVAFSNLKSHLC